MVETREQKGSRQDVASVALRSSRSFSDSTTSESSALAFALRVGEADPTGAPKPRLLDRVRAAILPGSGSVSSETFMVPALDPGIQLHVRNKRPAGEDRFSAERIVLFVHGATFPSETGFDIELPGGSWMDFVARRGFDAYFVDVRGYGRSTRPAAMEQPPAANAPFADTREAVRDITAAVEFILKRRGVPRINLVGWSWGTTTKAGYAAENPAKVEKLVLYAPVWFLPQPPPYQGAYRIGTRDSVRPFNSAGIPKERIEEISPTEWYDKWWAANLATDPVGASRNPPVLRSRTA